VEHGDKFLCYLVRLQRWCGVLEISGVAFEDTTPIFADSNDPFSIRFNVSPVVTLDFEHSIPIAVPDLWTNLSFTKSFVAGSVAWAQAQRMRQSLVQISEPDGDLICRLLQEQGVAKKRYELDAADRRHITQRTVARTEIGEVEVEVPEREEIETEPVEEDREMRQSRCRQTSHSLAQSSASTFGSLRATEGEFPRHCRTSIATS
jgi:hypothetical protein